MALTLLSMQGDESEAQKKRRKNKEYFYHYTDEKGLGGITSSMRILPNAKGKVYLSKTPLTAEDVFQNIFLSQPTHKERGKFLIIFELTPSQRAALQFDPTQPFEYIYPLGTLKLDPSKITWMGPNLFK